MNALTWGGARGSATRGSTRITLAAAPALGFPFDAVAYDDSTGVSMKTLAGVQTALASSEISSLTNFVAGIDALNAVRKVWGITQDGVALGLVDPAAAYAITPPQIGLTSTMRWNFATKTWIETATAVNTAAATVTALQAQVTAALAAANSATATASTAASTATQAAQAASSLPALSTAVPKPESTTAAAGTSKQAAPADHVHPRLSSSTFITLSSTSTATATFTQAFDAMPTVTPTPVVPAGQMPVTCVIQSWIQDTNGKYTGCVIKGSRAVALPTIGLTTLLPALITILSNYNPMGGTASGVAVSVLAVKSSA